MPGNEPASVPSTIPAGIDKSPSKSHLKNVLSPAKLETAPSDQMPLMLPLDSNSSSPRPFITSVKGSSFSQAATSSHTSSFSLEAQSQAQAKAKSERGSPVAWLMR